MPTVRKSRGKPQLGHLPGRGPTEVPAYVNRCLSKFISAEALMDGEDRRSSHGVCEEDRGPSPESWKLPTGPPCGTSSLLGSADPYVPALLEGGRSARFPPCEVSGRGPD